MRVLLILLASFLTNSSPDFYSVHFFIQTLSLVLLDMRIIPQIHEHLI